jgi:hypothetical protein
MILDDTDWENKTKLGYLVPEQLVTGQEQYTVSMYVFS